MKQKAKYLLACTKKRIAGVGCSCPSCGCTSSIVVSRKYLVTTLNRCNVCQLLFRTPTTTVEENASFYQKEYTQGFTTDLPSNELLAKHLKNNFSGGRKDYSSYIEVILSAGGKKGHRLFDFGCSWGYGSWQFIQQGFNVVSYEISAPRANYAKNKLGIEVCSSLPDASDTFDIFLHLTFLSMSLQLKSLSNLGCVS